MYGSDGPYGAHLKDGSFDMADAYEFAVQLLSEKEKSVVSSEMFLSLLQ